MRLFRLIYVCFILILAGPDVQAQIRIIPREQLEAMANPRLSSDSSFLDFDVRRIVADRMNESDDPKVFKYPFTNIGPEKLEVKRLVSNCSCASAICHKKQVEPGESAVITVTYNPEGHPGKFERRVFVYTQDGNSPAAILKLEVEVEGSKDFSGLFRHQMGSIRLRRKEVTFSQEKKAVETIPFVNLSGKPLRLECDRMMLPKCLDFAVEPEIVGDRQEGMIKISFAPEKLGTVRQMQVLLKNLGVSPSRSAIKVNVLPKE